MTARPQRSGAWLLVCALVAAIAACGTPAAAPTTHAGAAPVQNAQITVNGVVRTYRAFDPTPESTTPKPLVLVLHGGMEQGDAMVTRTGFDDVAAAHDFIVVYPDGAAGHWNSGSCCGKTAVSADDELTFFTDLLDRLERDHHVDTGRVYVTGLSAGGYMAYRLACALAARITAIASVSATMPDGDCSPVRPVSVMEIHGTADDQVPYDGGLAPGISAHSPAVRSVMASWASRDQCRPLSAPGGDTAVQTLTWTGCAGNATVVLDTVPGAGHNWYSKVFSGPDGALEATDTVWQFFSGLRS